MKNSDLERIQREPLLGTGALPFFRELIVIAAGLGLVVLVLGMIPSASREVQRVVFGERSNLQPGDSVTVDGYKITRTH